MRFLSLVSSLFLLTLAACSTDSAIEQNQSAQPSSPQPETVAQTQPQAQSSSPKNLIQTRSLNPQQINIQVEDLPQPFQTDSASNPPQVIPIPQNPVLNVPEGFTVNVYAEGLDRPRWLALTPEGDVLVTETRQNRIRRLSDRNGDGAAEVNQIFATAENGLNQALGMAFANGYFFLGNTDAVLRFPYQQGQTALNGQGQKIADLPADGYNNHWTRNVVASPDGNKLFVSIGSGTNVDEEPLPRASVQIMNLDGSDRQTFASGLRNPVGLDFHPTTGELYTTVNERDGLGDDLVPDYLTHLEVGDFYGWPYSYLAPNKLDPRRLVNDRPAKPDLIGSTKTPDVLFQAHSAALGLQIYDGDTFPNRYQNGAFVAFRGSWNRNQGTGYKIVFVPFDARTNRPAGYYEDFVTGFLTQPTVPATWGRPVGVLVVADGSLLFTDEANGRIYRVQYQG
ncbi:sorbosone dehydrogenase family protein [Leptolyngbya sp. FACHB-711]|uniref:PQQ-dependent sugar dehydrogenase n=1 Tax=Leptolyngbya sp. FACHB-711 TaxID=2692813 RepID=UPI0016892ADE|nr:sorbosone dehydrogenase family protein [Leptolyngbya sp. FACHB-711]MBD2023406.1 PQQ-dependent sugar dehydrogenase [Leptolyngbya sp. FACHB-711]